jgi:MFS family permease
VRDRQIAKDFQARARTAWRNLDIFGIRRAPRQLHPALKSLWALGVLASSAGAFFANYVTLYLLALGATRTEVGWLASIANLLGLLGPVPGAALTRRWGKPRSVVVVFSVLHRAMLVLAAALPLLLSGRALIYAVIACLALRLAFLSVLNPAFVTLIGSVIPKGIRGHYLGSRLMAMALASAVLVPTAGWLIDRIGEPLGYQVTLVIAFFFGLGSALAALRIPQGQIDREAGAPREGGSLWEAVRHNREFGAFLAIRLLWHFVWQVGGPYFLVYQKEVLLSSTQLIGTIATVSALTRLVGQRFWGTMVDRKGARWVLTICCLTISLLPFVWVFATRPWHVVFSALPGGFLWAGFNMGALNILLELPEARHRTQAAAANLMAIRVGNIVGPLVGNLVIQYLGYKWDFAISGLGRLAAAILLVVVLKPFVSRAMTSSARAQAATQG